MPSARGFSRSAAPFSSQIRTGLLRVYGRNLTAGENASGLPCCGRAVHGLVGPVKVPHGPRTRITGRIVLRRTRGRIRECWRRNRSLTGSPDKGLSRNVQKPLKVQRSVYSVPASGCGSSGIKRPFNRRQATGGALHGTECTDFTASLWQRGGKRFSSHACNDGADWISVSSRGAETAWQIGQSEQSCGGVEPSRSDRWSSLLFCECLHGSAWK
jgi:hypothetical protein